MATPRPGPWLPDGAPAPGRVARALIRSAADIDLIDAVTPDDVLPAATIYGCIRAAALAYPRKLAVVHLQSADPAAAPRTLTFRTLLESIERAANLFHAIAGGERSSVGIILPMVPEALIAAWAASTAGIASPINPYLEVEAVTSLLNASRVTTLVIGNAKHGRGAWDKLSAITAGVPTLRRVLVVDSDDTADTADTADDFATAMMAHPVGLTFEAAAGGDAESTYLPTGGTTAAPKLVRMSHRGQLLMAWLIGAHAGSAEDDVIGHAMPNFHVGGANLLTLRAALYGQTLVTLTTEGFRNPDIVRNFWDVARRFHITSLIATPATAAAMLAQQTGSAQGHAIRAFNCGGSTVPVEVMRSFHERFGVWLREIWGMSEIHGMVSIHPDPGHEPVVGSVGRAVPWHRILVVEVDADNRFVRTCAPGERGNLLIGGAALARGYVDQRYDDAFFVNGMPDGGRWANTGDLGSMDAAGHVWIFGRAKDVIIRGGHNIDPKMIEDVLVRHPAVQIAAAIGQPDAAKGEMPIAYVQLKREAVASAEELIALCRAEVQERAAVPVAIFIVPQIPLTAVGKINKPALRIDAMLRVAGGRAAGILPATGSFTVSADESGIRPRVRLAVAAASYTSDVAAHLQAAFSCFEFETLISVTPAAAATSGPLSPEPR